jgi:hypothetical protein
MTSVTVSPADSEGIQQPTDRRTSADRQAYNSRQTRQTVQVRPGAIIGAINDSDKEYLQAYHTGIYMTEGLGRLAVTQ